MHNTERFLRLMCQENELTNEEDKEFLNQYQLGQVQIDPDAEITFQISRAEKNPHGGSREYIRVYESVTNTPYGFLLRFGKRHPEVFHAFLSRLKDPNHVPLSTDHPVEHILCKLAIDDNPYSQSGIRLGGWTAYSYLPVLLKDERIQPIDYIDKRNHESVSRRKASFYLINRIAVAMSPVAMNDPENEKVREALRESLRLVYERGQMIDPEKMGQDYMHWDHVFPDDYSRWMQQYAYHRDNDTAPKNMTPQEVRELCMAHGKIGSFFLTERIRDYDDYQAVYSALPDHYHADFPLDERIKTAVFSQKTMGDPQRVVADWSVESPAISTRKERG